MVVKPSRGSMMQPFRENSLRLLAVNFLQKTPSYMFKWILETSLNKNFCFYIRIFGI